MSLKRSCEEGPDPKRTRYQEDYIVKSEPTSNEDEQLDMQFVKVEPPDFDESVVDTENLVQFPLVTVKSEPSDEFFNEDYPNVDPLSGLESSEVSSGIFQPPQSEICGDQTDSNSFYFINIRKDLLKNVDSVSKNVESESYSDKFHITCYRCSKQNITVDEFKNHLSLVHNVSNAGTEVHSFLSYSAFREYQQIQCTLCNGCLRFKDFENHVKFFHKICRICQIPVPKSFNDHVVCNALFTRIFQCTICYKECTKQESMLKHFTNEHPTSLLNFTIIPREKLSLDCPYCFYCSRNTKSLIFHVNLHRRKKCESCKKWFLPTSQHIGNSQLVKCLNCDHNIHNDFTETRSVTKYVKVVKTASKTDEDLKTVINVPSQKNDDSFSLVSKNKIISKMASGKPTIYLRSQKSNNATKSSPVSTKNMVFKKTIRKPTIVLSPRINTIVKTSETTSEKISTIVLSSQKNATETSTTKDIVKSPTATPKKICILRKQDSVSNPKTISIISKGKKLTLVPKTSGINPNVCIIKSKDKKIVNVVDPLATELNEFSHTEAPSKSTSIASTVISSKSMTEPLNSKEINQENVIKVIPVMSKEYMPIKPILAKPASSTYSQKTSQQKITIKDLGGKMTSPMNASKWLVKTTPTAQVKVTTPMTEVPKILVKTTPNQVSPQRIIIKEFDGKTVKAMLAQDNVSTSFVNQPSSVLKSFFKLDDATSLKVPLILSKKRSTGTIRKVGITKIAKPIIGKTVVEENAESKTIGPVNETMQPQALMSPVKHILIKSSLSEPSTSKDSSYQNNAIFLDQNIPYISRKKIYQHASTTETNQSTNEVSKIAKEIMIQRVESTTVKRPNIPENIVTREFTKKQNLCIVDSKEADSVVKYPCNRCSKLLDLSSLNQHIRLDHFFCGNCGGKFDNFMYLQKHYQTCTLKSYKCWICDQVLANKMELKLHTSTQHLNCPPDTRYKSFKLVHQLFDWSCITDSCPYCLKSLSQFSDVDYHLKMDHQIIKCENDKCSAFKVQQQKCRQCVKVGNSMM